MLDYEIENKISSLERELDNLRYEFERKIRDLENDLDNKANKEHYHSQYQEME